MKILHRVSLYNADPGELRDIERMGLKLDRGGAVLVPESDARWRALSLWAAEHRRNDGVSTEFSQRELDDAPWLQVVAAWHHGYPEPAGDNGYQELTYDPASRCPGCGKLTRQVAPFRMAGEPKWGNRSILQLYWVYDQYFARPEVHEAVFAPLGIASRPVLNRRGSELRTVVQLVIDEEVPLDLACQPRETCASCGEPQYAFMVRGPSALPLAEPRGHLAWSREWFGSGWQTDHAVLASQALRRAILAAGARGVGFRPATGILCP